MIRQRPIRWFAGEFWPVCALSAAVVGVLLVCAGGYGFHRDEFYIRESGRHLAWGYPDHPPLTPLLARVADTLAPGSLMALRVAPALAAAATVLLVGMIAREVGGDRRAQFLAAAAAAGSVPVLATGHILATASLDVFFAAALAFVLARLVHTGNERLWATAGFVLGVGLLNRVFLALYAVVLFGAVVAAGPRAPLRSRWMPAGILLAAAIAAPTVAWQARNGWPQWEMATAISSSNTRWDLLAAQLVLVGPLLAPVWIGGLIWLLRRPSVRYFGIAYLVMLAVLLATSGQPHYLFNAYPPLLAAGGVAAGRWLDRGAQAMRTALLGAMLAASAAVSAVVSLPIVPPSVLPSTPLVAINSELGEQIGWPEMARTVAGVVERLPAGQRADTVIVADNYGQAGALAQFGPQFVTPPASFPPIYGGHQAYAWWGPPPQRYRTAIVMGTDAPSAVPPWAQRACGRLREVSVAHNDHGIDNQENGTRVFLCQDLALSWAQLWPQIRRIGPRLG